MSWSDLYLMALGPILALTAGLFIYLSATLGASNRMPKSIGAGEGRGSGPQPGKRR
jgi:hypothetical protein